MQFLRVRQCNIDGGISAGADLLLREADYGERTAPKGDAVSERKSCRLVGNQVNVPYIGPVYTVVKEAPKAGTAAPAAKTPAPKDNIGTGAGDTVPTDPSDLPPGRPVADGADIDTTPPAAP